MKREEAIDVLKERYLTCVGTELDNHANRVNEAIDMAISALQAEAEPMTEEVREALMRLTMCARRECVICKYKHKCTFDFQYEESTKNMNTILDSLMRSKCEVDAKCDLISRADAIEVIKEYSFSFPQYMERFVTELRDAMKADLIDDLQNVPSADRPSGEWIIRDDMPKLDNTYSIECSECGQLMFGHYNADNPNYCPNCGARMENTK